MRKQVSALVLALALCVSLIAPAFAANFTDVPNTYWAYNEIHYVTNKGLFQGTTATTFAPGATMTRAMLTAVLYRYAGSPAVTGSAPYTDVAAGAYYKDAVTWAYQKDLYTDAVMGRTKLEPNTAMQRGEFAVMLYHFSQLMGDSKPATTISSNPFTDMSKAGEEIRTAILGWAYPNGILTGTTSTTMSPGTSVTRAQVAVMLTRYDKTFRSGSDGGETGNGTKAVTLSIVDSAGIALDSYTVLPGTSLIAAYSGADSATVSSSNPDVAKVTNYNGYATIWTASVGTATITVTTPSGAQASVTLTVADGKSPNPNYVEFTDELRDETRLEIVKLSNELRARDGAEVVIEANPDTMEVIFGHEDLSPLAIDDGLMRAAQIRADEMAKAGKMTHIRPGFEQYGNSLTEGFTALREEAGVDLLIGGENAGFSMSLSAEQIMDAWDQSQGHHDTICSPEHTHIGVGVARGEDGYYYCQIFGAASY